MKVKNILVGEYPPELGPMGQRLIVMLEGDQFADIQLDDMMSLGATDLAHRLNRLVEILIKMGKQEMPDGK